MRTSFEAYLLTLIGEGLGTPYELKSRADLSLGSTVPALARLVKEGLIKKSEMQARQSRRYSLTSKGRIALRTGLRQQLGAQPTDLDSILRIAYLMWRHRSPKDAADFLRESAVRLSDLAASVKTEAGRFGKHDAAGDDFSMRRLRAQIEERRNTAVADELISIARKLRKSSNGNRLSKSKATKP